MGILVIKNGFFTTVQDLGRIGYQESGFPVSGAMDTISLRIANMLVDNLEGEAGLELTMTGGRYRFTTSEVIAITGADMEPKKNGIPIPMYQAILFDKGDELSFEVAKTGYRTYIAFAGGLKIPRVMGSKSTYTKCKIGGLQGRALKNGDVLEFEAPKAFLTNFLSRKASKVQKTEEDSMIRVILGPQESAFSSKGITTFLEETYVCTSEFDRMGCRLDGAEIEHTASADIISDGISFGAIQVPAHGKPIIMMADRQTTGGYTKIATVITVDLPKLAQKKPGDTIRFLQVTVEEAQRLYCEKEMELEALYKEIHKPCIETMEPRAAFLRIKELFSEAEYNVFS